MSIESVNISNVPALQAGQRKTSQAYTPVFGKNTDAFARSVKFAGDSALPDTSDLLDEPAIKRALSADTQLDQAMRSAIGHATTHKVKETTTEYFLYNLLEPLLEITGTYDALKKEADPKNQLSFMDGKQTTAQKKLDYLRDFLPETAKERTLRQVETNKIFIHHIKNNWGKDLEKRAQEGNKKMIVGIDFDPRKFVEENSPQAEFRRDMGQREPNNEKKAPISPGKLPLSNGLKQVLTAFIQKNNDGLGLTFENFLNFLLSLDGTPGLSSEVQSTVTRVKNFRTELNTKIDENVAAKMIDPKSYEGLKLRLGQIWDKVPPAQRTMTQDQYYHARDLLEKIEGTGPNDINATADVDQLHEILYKLPWSRTALREVSADEVQKALDEDHYGLEEPKKRVVNYMGNYQRIKKLIDAGKMSEKDTSTPILGMFGPPGVGKTSLAQSLGKATGRKIERISLGGMRDVAKLKGHRKTYIGAMAGEIIKAMEKAGTLNPIIVLDEVDKVGQQEGFSGDPTAALLEILDPGQNKAFLDEYIGMPVDLSGVMFIMSGNDLGQVPAPLRDRMDKIMVSGYTTDEKIEIAERHLIPKIRKSLGLGKEMYGLPEEGFTLPREVLKYLIQNYAPEQGVRALENAIKVMGQNIGRILSDIQAQRPLTLADFPKINLDALKELIGPEVLMLDKLDTSPKIGIVNGMFYSTGPRPGGVLPIGAIITDQYEVSDKERPSLVLGQVTGMMKETMTESAKRAFSYTQANKKKYGIDLGKNKTVLEIHTNDQMPKDGPSAGGTFELMLISLLRQFPIPGDYAMTGEFNPLTGAILPIGGVREKISGTYEQGGRKFCLPWANRGDIAKLPKAILEDPTVRIRAVKHIDEVLDFLGFEFPKDAKPIISDEYRNQPKYTASKD